MAVIRTSVILYGKVYKYFSHDLEMMNGKHYM